MTAAALGALLVCALGLRCRVRPAPRRVHSRRRHRSRVVDLRARWRSRRVRGGPAEVATWCEALARAVRGGATLTAALRAVTPPRHLDGAIRPMQLALERGASLHDVSRHPTVDPDLALVIAVVRAIAEVGGAVAEPLDRAAASLRARAADRDERRLHSAQARASAAVMTALPIATLVLMSVWAPSVRSAIATPAGALVVMIGIVLNVLGWSWMRRTIGVSAR